MTVSSSVDLPTPLRPSTARLPFVRHFERNVVEHHGVAVARAHARAAQAAVHDGFTEVDLAHALVARDLVGRALHQDAPAHHHDDAAGEAEHHVHVVLDEKDGQLARQVRDRVEQRRALVLRHAGGGLVEQQHARARGEGERDFEQALLAVGEFAGLRGSAANLQGIQDPLCLVDGGAEARQAAPPVVRMAVALEHGKRDRLQRARAAGRGC